MIQMMTAGAGGVKVLMMVFLFSLAIGGKNAVAEVHHVVGDDQGLAPSTDVSLFTGRVFKVGDKIYFAYPATEDSIMELQTFEEFYSCDLSNPIRMYTNGLDKVSLDSEGVRFFTSGNLENCKNGLKLHVNVQSQVENEPFAAAAAAAGPTTPSASAHFTGLSMPLFVALALSFMGI